MGPGSEGTGPRTEEFYKAEKQLCWLAGLLGWYPEGRGSVQCGASSGLLRGVSEEDKEG